MKLFLSIVVTLFLSLTLSANCGKKMMHQGNCKNENCSMQMKKQKCDMPNCKNENCNIAAKKQNCGMKECNHGGKKMSCDMHKKHDYKMKNHGFKNEAKSSCGCGMSVESCKKMMKSCKFRDAKEVKETINNSKS